MTPESHIKTLKATDSLYAMIHTWIRKNFGSAHECEFCHRAGAKSYEWALIKGFDYDYKREHFMQLCSSCHRLYDGVNTVNRVKVVRIGDQGIRVFDSIKQASEITGISRTSIQNTLSGRAKTAGGYIWQYQ